MFKWLGWVAALAALSYVAKGAASRPVHVLVALYYLAMFFYFNAYFFNLTYVYVPPTRGKLVRHGIALLLSALLSVLVSALATIAIVVVASAKP
jgi:hypothetical protein